MAGSVRATGSELLLLEVEESGGASIGAWRVRSMMGENEWSRTYSVTGAEGEVGVMKMAGPGKEAGARLETEQGILKAAARNTDGHLRGLLDSGAWRDGEGRDRQWLVRESAECGLEEALRARDISWTKLGKLLRQLFAALEELHSFGQVHRGVAPSAFGLAGDGRLLITDLCHAARPKTTPLKPDDETLEYLSPRIGIATWDYAFQDDLLSALLVVVKAGDPNNFLPWTGLAMEEGAWLKWVTPAVILLSSAPPQLRTLYTTLRTLKPDSTINYAKFQRLLSEIQ